MNIPINPTPQPYRHPLELCNIQLYSTGSRGKVFTNHFYRSMNHNFGVEMQIRNNTSQLQIVRIGGRIYDSLGNTVIKWNTATKQISARCSVTHDFFVRESTFSTMRDGKYKVQFWINGERVQKDFFTVSYK